MNSIHDPLLDPGLHECTVGEIRERCVEDFRSGGAGNPKVRREIMDRFEEFIAELQTFNTQFEIWIDGSFVTEKPQPNDVDIVIFGDLNTISGPEAQRFENLCNYAEQRYLTEAYFCPFGNQDLRSYWRGWYLFDRMESPKGAFKIEIK